MRLVIGSGCALAIAWSLGAGSARAAAPAITTLPTTVGTTSATVTGTVNPEGLATTVHFEFGLDSRFRIDGRPTTYSPAPELQVVPDFASHQVATTISGLLPNALYHMRLVATNGDGTTTSADQTFQTRADPAPPKPVLGKSENVAPAFGRVLVKKPRSRAFALLTERRQIPVGSQIDARRGTIKLTAAAGHGKLQTGRFGSAVFGLMQLRRGLEKGLTILRLLSDTGSCAAHPAADPRSDPFGPIATAALSGRVLQTLRASVHGHFRTRGRYSAGTVRGTTWETIDQCDGTLTVVQRGTVDVYDFGRRVTIPVHAGERYLASKTP
jgi:hypothetical protein